MRDHTMDQNSVGFIFGGDANCGVTHWREAHAKEQTWKLSFETARFIFARCECMDNPVAIKNGDVAIGMGRLVMDFVLQDCFVTNRESQHDCMVVRWKYRESSHDSPQMRHGF